MSKQKIALCAFLALVMIGVAWTVALSHPRTLGHLPAKDIREIRKLVWRDVRDVELPRLGWDDLQHLSYVTRSLRRYSALHILWIDVKDDHSVRVVIGLSRKTISTYGWDFMVEKHSKWEITGTSYWTSLESKPHDFRIPPD